MAATPLATAEHPDCGLQRASVTSTTQCWAGQSKPLACTVAMPDSKLTSTECTSCMSCSTSQQGQPTNQRSSNIGLNGHAWRVTFDTDNVLLQIPRCTASSGSTLPLVGLQRECPKCCEAAIACSLQLLSRKPTAASATAAYRPLLSRSVCSPSERLPRGLSSRRTPCRTP